MLTGMPGRSECPNREYLRFDIPQTNQCLRREMCLDRGLKFYIVRGLCDFISGP